MTPFDELATADGRLDRPVSQAGIELYDVQQVGTDLVWEWRRSVGHYKPKPGLLERFAKLATRSNDEIVAFARSHGVLGICKHGVPHTHKMAQRYDVIGGIDCEDLGCQPEFVPRGPFKSWQELVGTPHLCREPIDAWRSFSRKALAILRIASNLHQNAATLDEDWQAIQSPQTAAFPKAWWQRLVLARVVNDWIVMGNVRPAFDWFRKPAVVYTSDFGSRHSTLFGVLALQVLLVASGSQGLATCSACQAAFIPKRKPRQDRRSYCDACRKDGAPIRDAKRAERARGPKPRRVRR